MAKYISAELSNLIKARGYAQGALTRARKRVARLRLEIECLELVSVAEQAKITRLDKEIGRLAPKLDPKEIRAQRKLKRPGWRYGAFNASLTRLIKAAVGEVSTTELVAGTARELGVPLTPVENYERHRDRVRRQLAAWVARGFLERLHDPTQGYEGRWQWRRPGPP